jgi:hypothetical protein
MTKIIIRLPYPNDEFKYDTFISDLEKFLHQKLDPKKRKYEIYLEEEMNEPDNSEKTNDEELTEMLGEPIEKVKERERVKMLNKFPTTNK